MTDNQEKELFTTLASLVTGVNAIQSDVRELKSDVIGLKSNVTELKSDVTGLKSDVKEIKQTLNEHSQIFVRLEFKIDSVADKVLDHENRLTKAEKNIEDIQSGIH